MFTTPQARLVSLVSLLSITPLISATISFNKTYTFPNAKTAYYDGVVPSGSLSSSCASVWARTLPCDEWLFKGQDESDDGPGEAEKFSKTTLDALCTDQCIDSLVEWRDDLRKGCTVEDAKVANETFTDSVESGIGGYVLALVMKEDMKVVETLYWPTCIRDLSTKTLCYLETANNTQTDKEPEAAICTDSCSTQVSIFTWEVSSTIYSTREINIPDVRKTCPALDTSKFPFLNENSKSTSSSSSNTTSGSSTEAGGKNSSTRAGGNGTAPVAGGALAMEVRGLGWVVGTVGAVVAVLVL